MQVNLGAKDSVKETKFLVVRSIQMVHKMMTIKGQRGRKETKDEREKLCAQNEKEVNTKKK